MMNFFTRPIRRYKLSAAALAAFAVAATVGATARSPVEVLTASNAALRRTVLGNGMICLVKEDRSAPVVAVQFWVGTGSIHEQEFLGGGLSHYLEHMVFKGTPSRGPAEVTKTIDGAGGDINAYTSFDRTVYHAVLPGRHWRTGVDVLSDAVLNASFPEEEWAREREVVLREVAMGRDDPDRVMSKLLFAGAYRVHPYRFPVIGHDEVLTTMTREELMTFHRRHYVPDNMIAVVVGDIEAHAVEDYLAAELGSVPRRPRAPVVVPQEPPQLAPRQVRRTGAYQVTRLEWAFHTVSLTHPDTPALDVLAQLVGAGRSSRLVRDVKEQRRLVHDVSAWSYTPRDPGLFGVSVTCDPGREQEAVVAVREQIASWAGADFPPEEMEKAKRQILVGELSQLQTAEGQARSYGSGEFYAGNPRLSEVYLESVRAVSGDDLRRVARMYLRPAGETLITLAPEAAPQPAAAPAADTRGGEVQRLVLGNGVRLLVREDHRLPFVYLSAALRGGLLSETEENSGISRLAADLLTRGTDRRSAEAIADTVESLGGTLEAFSGRNSFGLNARCLSGDEETFLALLGECLLAPAVPAGELEKQRELQLAAIAREREQPMHLAQEGLNNLLHPGHPYRRHPLGRPETVSAVTREAVRAHLARLAVSSNLVLSVFGDITPDRAAALAEQVLGRMPRGAAPHFAQAVPERELPARFEQREPKEQAILLMGFPGVAVDDPRADALDLLQNALSGLSSDLGIEVRDRRGLVYYVGAYQQPGLEPGSFVFYAGTREEAVSEVEALIGQQIERVTRKGLRQEEFERSRRQIIARHQRSLQDNGALAQACALNELYELGYEHVFETEERLNRLTREQVRRVANEILRAEHKAVSTVLPAERESES